MGKAGSKSNQKPSKWKCSKNCICLKQAKRMPYGAKGWDYCAMDCCTVTIVNNKVPRQRAKAEIRSERKRIGK